MFVHQKWPQSTFLFVNFIISHYEIRVQGGGGRLEVWHDAFGVCWSAAAGAYWPIATYCPSLGPFPSVCRGAQRPLTALCPSSPSLAYHYVPVLSLGRYGGLSLFHGGGLLPSPLARPVHLGPSYRRWVRGGGGVSAPFGVLWVTPCDRPARKLSKTKSSSVVPEAPFGLEKDMQQGDEDVLEGGGGGLAGSPPPSSLPGYPCSSCRRWAKNVSAQILLASKAPKQKFGCQPQTLEREEGGPGGRGRGGVPPPPPRLLRCTAVLEVLFQVLDSSCFAGTVVSRSNASLGQVQQVITLVMDLKCGGPTVVLAQ